MLTTIRRSGRGLGVLAVLVGAVAVSSSAAGASTLWQETFGASSASDYEVTSSVAFGPDGMVHTVGHRTDSFDGDPATSTFDLVVRGLGLDGAPRYETVVPAPGTGLAEVDIGVDGSGDVWVFVDRSSLFVLDSAGSVLSEPGDFPAVTPRPATSGAAASTAAGFLLAEPASGTLRLLARDGSTGWTRPLDPNVTTSVGLVPVADGMTVLVACHSESGRSGLLVEQITSSGATVFSQVTEGRVPVRSQGDIYLAGQLTFPDRALATKIDHAVDVLVADSEDGSCEAGVTDPSAFFHSHSVEQLTSTFSQTAFVSATACVTGSVAAAPDAESGSCRPEEITVDTSTSAFDTDIRAALSPGRDTAVVVEEPEGRQLLARFSSGSAAVVRGELVGGERLPVGFTVNDMAFDDRGNLAVVGQVEPSVGGAVNPRGFVLTNPWVPWFHDVHRDWQVRPVDWLWNTGLTTGVAPWLYAPERLLTRAEAATFLHRAVGEPEVAADHGFVDVVKDWQQGPVRWLKANGITTGVDAAHFAPERPIGRGEFATMIWRAVGEPDGLVDHGFADVDVVWQDEAIRWLKANGITTGVDADHFAPERTLTRGETAAFLFRLGLVVDLPSLA